MATNRLTRAESRGYNDFKLRGVTTCPFKDEDLQHFWLEGFNRAYAEKKAGAPVEVKLMARRPKQLTETDAIEGRASALRFALDKGPRFFMLKVGSKIVARAYDAGVALFIQEQLTKYYNDLKK